MVSTVSPAITDVTIGQAYLMIGLSDGLVTVMVYASTTFSGEPSILRVKT